MHNIYTWNVSCTFGSPDAAKVTVVVVLITIMSTQEMMKHSLYYYHNDSIVPAQMLLSH